MANLKVKGFFFFFLCFVAVDPGIDEGNLLETNVAILLKKKELEDGMMARGGMSRQGNGKGGGSFI